MTRESESASRGAPSRHRHTGRGRGTRSAGVGLVAVLALAGLAPASGASSDASNPGAALAAKGTGTDLLLRFEKGDGFVGGRTVRNRVGPGEGTVVVADGGRLYPRRGAPGRAAQFPCPGCGRAIIEVPDRAGLDPRNNTFRFGADVRVSPRRAERRTNVVQKGYYRQSGGQYKLQVDHGYPNCVVSGSAGRVVVRTTTYVAGWKWHRVNCIRRPDRVVLRIDGVVRGRAFGVTGRIANDAPLRIGGKNVKDVASDQYRGRLDDVLVDVRR